MRIKWLGHSPFLVTSEVGTKIVTDPYSVGEGISYAPINQSADVVTISHNHEDHDNDSAIKGNPQSIREEGIRQIKGIEFKGIPSHHDAIQGSERGGNIVFCFTVDGINICHLGDLGHILNNKQIADIGSVDILLIPVGGYYTIDYKQATTIAQSLRPKVVIPMHYKNSNVTILFRR